MLLGLIQYDWNAICLHRQGYSAHILSAFIQTIQPTPMKAIKNVMHILAFDLSFLQPHTLHPTISWKILGPQLVAAGFSGPSFQGSNGKYFGYL